jgi:hypothetical protein
MKKVIATLALLAISNSQTLVAQTDICAWAKNGTGSAMDAAISVTSDENNNVISGGWFYSPTLTFGTTVLTNANNTTWTSDAYLVKYDAAGNVQWAKSFGGTGEDAIRSIVTDTDGKIYVLGNFASSSITIGSTPYTNAGTGYQDLFLIKLDADGTILWSKKSSGSYSETGEALSIDANGNLLMVGSFNSSSFTFGSQTVTGDGTSNKAFLFKIAGDGSVVWNKVIEGAHSVKSCAVTSDNAVVFIGSYSEATVQVGTTTLTNAGSSSYDIFVGKYDTDGTFVWAKSFGGDAAEEITDVAVDLNDKIYITGNLLSLSADFGGINITNSGTGTLGFNGDFFIAKMDQSGTVEWARSAGTSNSADGGRSIVTDINGIVYVVGGYDSSGINFGLGVLPFTGSNQIFMVTYNATGTAIFNQKVGSTMGNNAHGIGIDNAGNILVAGDFSGSPITFGSNAVQITAPSNYGDGFVAKFNANYVGINELTSEDILSIAPNPSNGKITIQSKEELNAITITNTDGKIVFDCAKNTYFESILLNNSGVYFISLSGNDFIINKKVVITD